MSFLRSTKLIVELIVGSFVLGLAFLWFDHPLEVLGQVGFYSLAIAMLLTAFVGFAFWVKHVLIKENAMNHTKMVAPGYAAIALMLAALFFAFEAWLSVFGLPVWLSCVLGGLCVVSAHLSGLALKHAIQTEVARLIDEAIDRLPLAGFVETTYDGQEGIFYTKRQQARDMPYVREHIIANDEVLPETEVIVEVTPDKQVQMRIPDADYVEGPFAFESDEAFALLEDAGFPLQAEVAWLIDETIDRLPLAGFIETTYDGQEGIFYTKRQQARDMPCVVEHIIDNDEVLPETEVIVEVTPDKQVQMRIPDADYVVGPFAFESEEAFVLLKDAGLICPRCGEPAATHIHDVCPDDELA